jgi:outer membrane protein TolC
MKNLFKRKPKTKFEVDPKYQDLSEQLRQAKNELDVAQNSFDQATGEYVELAILNLELAQKRYQLLLKELREAAEKKVS